MAFEMLIGTQKNLERKLFNTAQEIETIQKEINKLSPDIDQVSIDLQLGASVIFDARCVKGAVAVCRLVQSYVAFCCSIVKLG
jgi:hypothetical protein